MVGRRGIRETEGYERGGAMGAGSRGTWGEVRATLGLVLDKRTHRHAGVGAGGPVRAAGRVEVTLVHHGC